jgi:hypothetical protein
MSQREDVQHPVADLQGQHVVVTAGGTREPIDPTSLLGIAPQARWASLPPMQPANAVRE